MTGPAFHFFSSSSFWCILFIPCTLLGGPSILTYARSLHSAEYFKDWYISQWGCFSRAHYPVSVTWTFPRFLKIKEQNVAAALEISKFLKKTFWEISPRLLLFFGIINKYFVVSFWRGCSRNSNVGFVLQFMVPWKWLAKCWNQICLEVNKGHFVACVAWNNVS